MSFRSFAISLLFFVSWFAGTTAQAEELFRKSYAVVVGIDRYQSDYWDYLPNSVNDAREMKRYLESQGFEVKPFFRDEAVSGKIISYLEDTLAPRVTGQDRFLFYFSGHGETLSLGGQDYGYIIPYEGEKGKPSTWISMDKLRELSRKLGAARHQLYIFDSCFGGLFAEKGPLSSIDEKFPHYIERISSQKARQYLTAGGSGERVPASGPKAGYSYFTGFLLSALEDGKADLYPDGYITASELNSYLEGAASGASQTPRGGTIAGHEQGNFLFRSPFPPPPPPEKVAADSVMKGGAGAGAKPAAGSIFRDSITGMKFVWVEGGCFDMGQRKAEKEQLIQEVGEDTYKKYFAEEVPLHRVCVDGFYMGKYEVTVGQFRQFVNETGYETDAEGNAGGADGCYAFKDDKWGWQSGYSWRQVGFPQQEDYPVACVSWNDAQKFIAWLNRKSGREFRLPTEAEWEYAARAGSRTIRYWGDAVDSNACDYANVANPKYWSPSFPCEDSYQFAAPVGKFKENNFGLYDMLGNVWEWCQDWYGEDYYSISPGNNPQGPSPGSSRVDRGGGWNDRAGGVRSAFRGRGSPGGRRGSLGFRLVLPPGQ
ncbi:MAG: SUMF1/EgtB/PvdO family nonheme iron enzyme [Proteobacteria bacterium]|nr:SUMF1/EgtB/PvdO family nonheme iron enzyme [Pseudomonadota bacterium]MBU4297503.1 SUMF1/EgtB/PvdO family nonheme iron enzyme [Pseudomonadota bacterium]MCG2749721.1 SUMF1/EgtB/PvdO family nonheme iron enzyme [Desulfobulbaceae bacterium]